MIRGGLIGLVLVGVTSLAHAQQQEPPSLDALERRARRDSNDAVAHYELAMGYWNRKKWDQADSALRTAVRIAPAYADAWLALSAIFEARGERYYGERLERLGADSLRSAYEASAAAYRRAFMLNPLVDLRVLGRAEPRRGIFVPLKYGSRAGFIISPPPWENDLVKGLNEFREARYDKALMRLSQLADHQRFGGEDVNVPNTILWYRGLAAAHVGQFDRAIRDFAILTGRAYAAETDSTWSGLPLGTNDFRYVLATILYLSGRHEQAVPVFQRALEFDLGLYAAHVQLARIHEAAGRHEEALRERQVAVHVNPDDADPLVDLAMTLLWTGRLPEAMDALDRAEGLNPRDARIPFLRGTVGLHLGRRDQARAALTRFLAIAPSRMGEQIAEARQTLSQLE